MFVAFVLTYYISKSRFGSSLNDIFDQFLEGSGLYGGSAISLAPTLVRSLLAVIAFDALLRTLFLILESSQRRRAAHLNSLLYAFGVQPIYFVILCVFFVQAVYLAKRGEPNVGAYLSAWLTFGAYVLALLAWVYFATPSILYGCRIFAPYLGKHLRPTFAKTIVAAIGIVVYIGAAAAAIVLGNWKTLDGPSGAVVSHLRCKIVQGRGEVLAVIENYTGRRLVIAEKEAANVRIGFLGDPLKIQSMETSIGNQSPFLLIDPGRAIWVRLNVVLSGQGSASGAPCRFLFGAGRKGSTKTAQWE